MWILKPLFSEDRAYLESLDNEEEVVEAVLQYAFDYFSSLPGWEGFTREHLKTTGMSRLNDIAVNETMYGNQMIFRIEKMVPLKKWKYTPG